MPFFEANREFGPLAPGDSLFGGGKSTVYRTQHPGHAVTGAVTATAGRNPARYGSGTGADFRLRALDDDGLHRDYRTELDILDTTRFIARMHLARSAGRAGAEYQRGNQHHGQRAYTLNA